MRLQHTHDVDGPVKIAVSADGMPVFINIDESAKRCSVDVVTSDTAKAIWAGPTGFRGSGLGVEVGGKSLINSLRGGSYVSGGGSVVASGGRGSIVSGGTISGSIRATGRGSIAALGNIENAVTGDGASITTGEAKTVAPVTGVHFTVPKGCSFSFRRFVSINIRKGDQAAVSLAEAETYGWVKP